MFLTFVCVEAGGQFAGVSPSTTVTLGDEEVPSLLGHFVIPTNANAVCPNVPISVNLMCLETKRALAPEIRITEGSVLRTEKGPLED